MNSRKILIMVLATAVFAMCLYMFGLEKPSTEPEAMPATEVSETAPEEEP